MALKTKLARKLTPRISLKISKIFFQPLLSQPQILYSETQKARELLGKKG